MLSVNSDTYPAEVHTSRMPSIGERIVALRTARGWSQPELARRVGIKQPSLHNIESGRTVTLRGATLAGLCRALSVTPDMILQGGSKAPSAEAMLYEQELLSAWRAMTPQDREHLMAIARALQAKMKPAPQQKPIAEPIKPEKQST